MTKQGCPHCGLSADLVQRGSCGHPAAEPCRTPSEPDVLPGLKRALEILTHPNAGMEPPDGGDPSEADRVRNVANDIRAEIARREGGRK